MSTINADEVVAQALQSLRSSSAQSGRLLPLKTRDELRAFLTTGEQRPRFEDPNGLNHPSVDAYIVEIPARFADKVLR